MDGVYGSKTIATPLTTRGSLRRSDERGSVRETGSGDPSRRHSQGVEGCEMSGSIVAEAAFARSKPWPFMGAIEQQPRVQLRPTQQDRVETCSGFVEVQAEPSPITTRLPTIASRATQVRRKS